jgi:hypothetical protein
VTSTRIYVYGVASCLSDTFSSFAGFLSVDGSHDLQEWAIRVGAHQPFPRDIHTYACDGMVPLDISLVRLIYIYMCVCLETAAKAIQLTYGIVLVPSLYNVFYTICMGSYSSRSHMS